MLNSPVNAKMFTRVLYKTATTLQHYDFVLLPEHINHVKISCGFSKVEDAYGPCVSLVQISSLKKTEYV